MKSRQIDIIKLEEERARSNNANSQRRANVRDIGKIPPVVNPARRRRCANNPPLFLRTYFPHAFYNKFSPTQLEDIRTMAEAIRHGGLFALAWPRGDGKTTSLIAMIVWAIMYGHRKYVVPIGSDAADAQSIIESIKAELDGNDLLLEDFPEACLPFRKLEGRPQKAAGQTCEREPTGIRMAKDMIQFPTTSASWAKCNGAIVESRGLTGRLRGMLRPMKSGQKVRPDLVVLNDPQTDESARSKSQTDERLNIIRKAVLGLAGQGKTIAGFALVTVIEKNDLADQLTDRTLNPQWQGVRRRMVYSWPKNAGLWQEYSRLRRECQGDGDTIGRKARDYYKKNRAAMDEGAKVGNPTRKDVNDLSAIEHAHCLLADLGQDAFNSEYQNDPPDRSGGESTAMVESALGERCTGVDRGVVASDSAYLLAFADLNQDSMHWMVAAFREDVLSHVVDYGNYAGWWDKTRSPEQNVAIGLDQLCHLILDADYPTAAGTRKVDKLAIDSGWMTDTVYQFAGYSKWRGMVQATKGEYVEVGKQMQAPQRAGTIRGENWVFGMVRSDKVQVRLLRYDADAWKTYLAGRLSGAPFTSGSLDFFGRPNQHHRLFGHLCSESSHEIEAKGMRKQKWNLKPGQKENHLLDCAVGLMAFSGLSGCRLKTPAGGHATTDSRPEASPQPQTSRSRPSPEPIRAKYLL